MKAERENDYGCNLWIVNARRLWMPVRCECLLFVNAGRLWMPAGCGCLPGVDARHFAADLLGGPRQ